MQRDGKRNNSKAINLVELIRNRVRYTPYPRLQNIEENDISSRSSGSLSEISPKNIGSNGEQNNPHTLNLVQVIRSGRNANRSHSSISSEELSINIANTSNYLNEDKQGFELTYCSAETQNSIAQNEVEDPCANAITENNVLEKEFSMSGKTVHGTDDGARKSTFVQTDPIKINKQTSTTELMKNTDCAEPPNEVAAGAANTHPNIEQPPPLSSRNSVKFPDINGKNENVPENIAELIDLAFEQLIVENPNIFRVVNHLTCDGEYEVDSVNLVQAESQPSGIAIEVDENANEAQHEVSAQSEVNEDANSNVRQVASEQSIDEEAGGDGLHIHPVLESEEVFVLGSDSEEEEDVALDGENNVAIDVHADENPDDKNEDENETENEDENEANSDANSTIYSLVGEAEVDIKAGGDGPHNDIILEINMRIGDLAADNGNDLDGGFDVGDNADVDPDYEN